MVRWWLKLQNTIKQKQGTASICLTGQGNQNYQAGRRKIYTSRGEISPQIYATPTNTNGCDYVQQMTVFFHLWYIPSIERIMHWVSSLAPGRYGSNFKSVIFKYMLQIKFMSASCGIAPRWMPQNIFDDESTLVQEMVWCCQATSHYLRQRWPKSMSPYDVTRPQ